LTFNVPVERALDAALAPRLEGGDELELDFLLDICAELF
jgi:hypothetical protein